MSDFKSYIKNNSQNNGSETNCTISESEKKQCEEKLKNTAKKYEGKSEDELMGEILKQVAVGKSSGELKNSDIDEFYKKVSPMLNREQRKKLDSIINKIK